MFEAATIWCKPTNLNVGATQINANYFCHAVSLNCKLFKFSLPAGLQINSGGSLNPSAGVGGGGWKLAERGYLNGFNNQP
jgi:hypothetical protein